VFCKAFLLLCFGFAIFWLKNIGKKGAVGEIDTCGQFHQHFTHEFFVRKCFFCQNVTREKLREALLYKKTRT